MPSERIVEVPRDAAVFPPLRVIAERLLYDVTLAILIVFFVVLIGSTVLAVRAGSDALGLPRVAEVAALAIAKVVVGIAAMACSHIPWMRR